jgi:hypothetical protein
MSDIGTHPIIDPRAVPEHVYAAAMRLVAATPDLAQTCLCTGVIWQWLWDQEDVQMVGMGVPVLMARDVLAQAAQYGVAYECKE